MVSKMSKEDDTPPSLSSGMACCCSMVVLRVLDWKLRSVDVLLLVLSEEKAMPENNKKNIFPSHQRLRA